ncbi:MAG: type II secretion system minor pseudopilin GspK [Pseudomonadota bacterium]|nr:type II secretion system minor pseudopilin GspK [Pseudomonadota bacterium]
MTVPPNQRGAALLTVLLLVAVMATIGTTALDRIGLATRLTANVSTLAQSRSWLGTAELLAVARIEDLLALDRSQTTLAGGWMGVERSISLPDGATVRATVGDGGNCFNLNGLAERPRGREQFVGLMTLLGIVPGEADRIASSAADYIDSDSMPLPAGAEDGSAATPPNAMMADASELRAVAGVTPRHYGMLERWVCALPVAEPAPINVNTLLPEQAPLLAMLAPGILDVSRARAQLSARPADGYGSVLNFWNSPVLSGLDIPAQATQQVKVRSSFFTVRATVNAGDMEVQESALVDARANPARIVRRQWGEAS